MALHCIDTGIESNPIDDVSKGQITYTFLKIDIMQGLASYCELGFNERQRETPHTTTTTIKHYAPESRS